MQREDRESGCNKAQQMLLAPLANAAASGIEQIMSLACIAQSWVLTKRNIVLLPIVSSPYLRMNLYRSPCSRPGAIQQFL